MKKDIVKLRYGNTNTFFLPGKGGGLLVDTDYAGTLQQFFRAIKTEGVEVRDISYVMATHYHPDHIGLAGELQKLGVTLVILEEQLGPVHFADMIFSRDRRIHYTPIDETSARVITCAESRGFLHDLGIEGEILHTPSHSEDCVSVLLDDGVCIVGDLEPMEYLEGYADNPQLQWDWEQIMTHRPHRILFAHANEKTLKNSYGCEKMTIQSGGTVNGLFLREKLFDFVDIVVAPVLIGGKDTPTLIDGRSLISNEELSQLGTLKLIEATVLENSYLRLKYKVMG